MEKEKIKENLKNFWNWLWNSESWLSYIVFLILVFIAIKFIFLPLLSLLMGTSLPMAIVESESMDHHTVKAGNVYQICGTNFAKKDSLNSEEYWATCGNWYEQNTNITKEKFEKFNLKNGFRKGDLIIIIGKAHEKIKEGDVLIFVANRVHPIIHRVISTNPLATKGDHNSGQLPEEKNIQENQLVGVAVAKVPYVGWIKLFFVELFRGFK